MSFEVNVCQKKRKCQSSFCEILWNRCTENIWNEKFYGCEKLYVTELLYERKRKAREKENFTAAPAAELLRDCVLYLSLFLLGYARRQRGPEAGSECVQRLPLILPLPLLPYHPCPALPDSSASATGQPVRQEWRRTLRERRGTPRIPWRRLFLPLSLLWRRREK